DLKEAGRLRAVPVHAVEDLVDGHEFGIPGGPTRDVLETDHLVGVDGRRHRRGGHAWPRAAAEAGGDLLVNGQGGAEHDDAPRGVLQLTDVAWPVILEEDAHGVGWDFDFASVLGSELGEEMTDEHRDLLAPLAQRGDPDLEDVQAVVQIFPELMGLHRGLEVAVGGRDEPHVGANDLLPPTRENSPSCRTCSNLAWSSNGISPISSKRSAP